MQRNEQLTGRAEAEEVQGESRLTQTEAKASGKKIDLYWIKMESQFLLHGGLSRAAQVGETAA